MKKIFLSGFIIISFLIYGLSQKIEDSQTSLGLNNPVQANTSPSISQNVSSTSAPSSADTSNSNFAFAPVPTSAGKVNSSGYKDGTYTGTAADAYYGNIQVQTTISGGKITKIQFLQYPNDRGTSIEINQYADPQLAQEAIQSQNANVDVVSGATDSSQAFIQSLQSALNQAKV